MPIKRRTNRLISRCRRLLRHLSAAHRVSLSI
jgi:hypothetical protein